MRITIVLPTTRPPSVPTVGSAVHQPPGFGVATRQTLVVLLTQPSRDIRDAAQVVLYATLRWDAFGQRKADQFSALKPHEFADMIS